MPIFLQSDVYLSPSDTDDTIPEKEKYEDSYEPILSAQVNYILLGILQSYKDPHQWKNSTVSSQSNQMALNFSDNVNKRLLSIINQTRVELKEMNSGDCRQKLDARKLAQMWDIGTKRAKKTVMNNNQNNVWDVTIPLTNQFQTSQVIFQWRRLQGTTYTDNMIFGVNSVSGNRVAQLY